MKYLLIGGERAGEMVDMEFQLERLRVPARPVRCNATFCADEAAKPTNRAIEEFHYNATTMVDLSGKRHTVYALEGIDPLLELIRAYKGQAS